MRGIFANDRLLPAPHQTGQAVFPHPAFRIPFLRITFALRHSVNGSCRIVMGAGSSCGAVTRSFASPQRIGISDLPWLLLAFPEINATMEVSDSCGGLPSLDRCWSCAGGWIQSTATGLPAYPSVTSRHVAHADPVGPLSIPRRLFRIRLRGLRPHSRGSAADCYFFEAHLWLARVPVTACPGRRRLGGSYVLRPAGSTPRLLPTPPRGDAVGAVFGAEPSNCTGGTSTRVDARFTGVLNAKI